MCGRGHFEKDIEGQPGLDNIAIQKVGFKIYLAASNKGTVLLPVPLSATLFIQTLSSSVVN